MDCAAGDVSLAMLALVPVVRGDIQCWSRRRKKQFVALLFANTLTFRPGSAY